jgi:hypothetical protein
MVLSQQRNQTWGLVVLVLLTLLVLQTMPATVNADGATGEPPPSIIDSTPSGTRCLPSDELKSEPMAVSLSLLDLIVLLTPLL